MDIMEKYLPFVVKDILLGRNKDVEYTYKGS